MRASFSIPSPSRSSSAGCASSDAPSAKGSAPTSEGCTWLFYQHASSEPRYSHSTAPDCIPEIHKNKEFGIESTLDLELLAFWSFTTSNPVVSIAGRKGNKNKTRFSARHFGSRVARLTFPRSSSAPPVGKQLVTRAHRKLVKCAWSHPFSTRSAAAPGFFCFSDVWLNSRRKNCG